MVVVVKRVGGRWRMCREQVTKEGQSRDKERTGHKSLHRQKQLWRQYNRMRVCFNLYGTVLSKDAFRPPLKVPEKLAFVSFLFFTQYILLAWCSETNKAKSGGKNSSAEKLLAPPSNTANTPIKEIHITVGSVPFLWTPAQSEVSPTHPWSGQPVVMSLLWGSAEQPLAPPV